MSFRNNLQHLRATRNMTQEQLAMLCGVSRQAVTKWEAERSYPEMDKLLRLCEIFDCSLDELVSGDLTHRESDPALAVPAVGSPSDMTGYEAHWKRYAAAISAGVLVASLGLTCSVALSRGIEQGVIHISDSVSVLPIFIGGAVATCIFAPAGMEHMRFNRKHPFIAPFYTESEVASQQKHSIWQILVGVVIAVAGLCILVASDQLVGSDSDWRTLGVTFLLWSIAASIMSAAGMRIYSLNIEDRNQNFEKSSDKFVFSRYSSQHTATLNSAICGIIMVISTIIALVWLFVAPGKESLFWLPWVVGGCLCGAVNIAFSVRRDE